MNVQQNFHVPILCTGDDKTISDENQCQNKVQTISGNSKSVKILEEFKHIYLERLRKIEEETPEEGAELKLKTLTSWINDLGEQNLMLVETVEQLEQEAADRVMLLEERLKKSSHIALEYLSKLEEYDNQFLNQAFEKDQPTMLPIKTSNRLMQAQQTEEILKTRIGNLQNDISGLLELIRRARYEGSWDTNGLSFLEVTYEDIFGLYPHQNIKKITDNLESADHLKTTKSVSQQKIPRALEDNILKDQGTKAQPGSVAGPRVAIGLSEKAEQLQSSSYGSPKEMSLGTKMLDVDTSKRTHLQTDNQKLEATPLKQRITGSSTEEMETFLLRRKAEHSAAQLQRLNEENQRLIKENKFLSINLKNKSDKIALLAQHLTEVDENLKRTKESMVAEVTEKNEQLLTVRQSMLRLEKYVIQADMQTHFKNAIIKEMRKDIKEAKSKLASQKRSQTAWKHVDANKCEKISNVTPNLFVPCLCLPNRLLFQESDQTCNEPIICCSDHIGGYLKPSFMVEKDVKRNGSMSHNKKSQTHFPERKFSSLPNTSCRQCQNLNRVRGHISVKVPDRSNAPKQQEKKISLCNSCNRKFFECKHVVLHGNVKSAVES